MGVPARPYPAPGATAALAGLGALLATLGGLPGGSAWASGAAPAVSVAAPAAGLGARAGGAPAVERGGLAGAVTRLDLGGFADPGPGVDVTVGRSGGQRTLTMTTRQLPTARFAAVGVTWRSDGRLDPLVVTVRVHTSTGGWGPWRRAEPSTDRGAARTGTDLVWTGPADGVQVSIGVAGGRGPRAVAAELIDPARSVGDVTAGLTAGQGAAPTVAARAAATAAMPPVLPRTAWRADESIMTWPTAPAGPLTGVVLREVATGTDYGQAEVPGMLRALYRYQADGLGWGDLGYHVVVDRFGRIWQGRSGARPAPGARPAAATGRAAVAGARPLVVALLAGAGGEVPPAAVSAAVRYVGWRLAAGPAVAAQRVTAVGPAAVGSLLDRLRAGVATALGARVDPAAPRGRLAVWRASDATWWLSAPGSPAAGDPGGDPVLTGVPGDLPAPADYDGDGLTDVAVWTPATGRWRYLATSTGAIGEATLGAPGDVPVPADYDGDGAAEPATWTPATGVWHTAGGPPVRWGRGGDVPLPGDYDRDGRAEPAVWRPRTGSWYMLGTGSYRLGSRNSVPVPADYDGDGFPEPAVWSPGSCRWFVAGRRPLRFGAPGDSPAPWQYDGDGAAEPAVVRSTAGGQVLLVRGGPTIALPDRAASAVPLN